MPKRIFLVAGGYLPGYKSGGPVRSIVNMVDWLGDDYQFFIMALDRDTGDTVPYPDVKVGEWQQVGKAQVLYTPMRQLTIWQWRDVLLSQPYDMIYQNSYFDPGSLKTTLLWRLGLIPRKPLVIAPRGELLPGAVNIKGFKKKMLIRARRVLGLNAGLDWHVTSEEEAASVLKLGGTRQNQVHVTANLPALVQSDVQSDMQNAATRKEAGVACMAFVSRITRKKNLLFGLQALHNVRMPLHLDIYGPIEDEAYWQQCQAEIAILPDHITVTYKGILQGDEVLKTVSQYHGFLLPTLSENFGHAILEALTVGCIPIISDQTPWRDLEQAQAGWDLPLGQPKRFAEAIERLITMDDVTWQQWSAGAKAHAQRFISESGVVDKTRQMFEQIIMGQ
jgi:glycosyltransferase involved in cell wall biosynthesis